MTSRRLASLAIASLVVLAAAAIAPAAKPVKGASYSGALNDRTDISVTFKVSGNGKAVRKLKLNNLPLYCEGGGPPILVNFKKAAVSDKGRFKQTAKTFFTEGSFKGDVQARVTIKGRFAKNRKARGTLKTDWNFSGDPDSCDGTSRWAAKAP